MNLVIAYLLHFLYCLPPTTSPPPPPPQHPQTNKKNPPNIITYKNHTNKKNPHYNFSSRSLNYRLKGNKGCTIQTIAVNIKNVIAFKLYCVPLSNAKYFKKKKK